MNAAALAPLRVRRRPARPEYRARPGMRVLGTGALGFLGSSQDDRQRWIASFRRLLDGLESPLQVLMRFVPGDGDLPADPAAVGGRGADLHFAAQLATSKEAQARQVLMVCETKAEARIEAALAEMGVPRLTAGPALTATCPVTELKDAVIDEDGWHRTWYLHRFPGVELEPGWLLRLVPPGAEVTLSWHAVPLPSEWVVEFLQRQLVNMRATRIQEASNASEDPLLRGALPTTEDLQRRLTASTEKAFHVSVYLTVSARDSESLAEVSERVSAHARSTLVELQPCTFRALAGRRSTLPLGDDAMQRQRVLDTSSLATLFPWLHADLRQVTGIVLGRSRETGCPVMLDLFDQARHANANVGVFGHSGAGKTYLLSTLAMGALGQGVQVFVIDPEHEYGKLAAQLGGVDVRLALGSGHSLNVLGLRGPAGDDEAWVGPAVADTVDLASVICGGLDESERAVVEGATRETYCTVEEPLLKDVAERLPPDARAARILRRWSAGSLGAIFSAPTNIDLEAPMVVFGMRELREELVGPVHFLLAEALWRRMKQRGRRRLLIVDELGLLFEDPTLRRFVVNLARRIRKYDGALVFATQNPGDLLSSDAGSVVATNPAIHFFGAQRPGEAAKLQRVFQLSDEQRTQLEVARRGEFLLSAGAERLPITVMAPPWQARIMNSEGRAAGQNL